LDAEPTLQRTEDAGAVRLRAAGDWTAVHADALERLVAAAEKKPALTAVDIDVSAVSRLDTFGAWLIERLRRGAALPGVEPRLSGLAEDRARLVEVIHQVGRGDASEPEPKRSVATLLETVGRSISEVGSTLLGLANMTGAIIAAASRVALHPSRIRFTSTVHHLEQVGWRAVPIVVLITFLIGCIIAQQGIFHFRKFGADVFVVDMVGVLVLREIGVLLVCIMVAGRSGSAFTAELGSMKMREEVDALQTMGMDPVEVLILPRMVALLIAVPTLTFLGSMAALYGGGLVSWLYGGLQPDIFLSRLREAISIDHFQVGMIKAPFMALVIGVVACVEGLAVRGSAESLGQHTTASVVKSIFFVIVLDGAFAIFFAAIGK
jgi:phospholipid/cholesterol/gamma-HCH transport system permease protein